jgi:hypothetical protein
MKATRMARERYPTMKFIDPTVMVPYIGMDEAGASTRNWMKLAFKGTVDHRRIKRMVRKTLCAHLERSVHTNEIRACVNSRRIQHGGLIIA